MIDLKKLTIKYLEDLADECQITLKKSSKKSEKIKTILNAGIPESKLKLLFERYLTKYKATKKPRKKAKAKPTSSIAKLEKRVSLIEEQIKFLMSKIGGVEVKLAVERTSDVIGSSSDLNDIKNIIKLNVLPGNSISIDELIKIKQLQKFSMRLIEKAIIDLIDDEILDISEGRSIQKISGNIGRLIRR